MRKTASRTKFKKKIPKRHTCVCVCVCARARKERKGRGDPSCQFAEADGPCRESYHLLGKKPVGCLLSPRLHIKPATVYVQSQIHSVHQLQSSKCRCPRLIIPAHSRGTSSSDGYSRQAARQSFVFFFLSFSCTILVLKDLFRKFGFCLK